MTSAFQRNEGIRIDHLLLSPGLADRLVAAGVDRAVRGEPGASDHAPAWIELRKSNVKKTAAKKSAPPKSAGKAAARPRR